MSEPLPAEVRTQVVAFAADTLAGLDDAEVPASLAAVRRFTPGRRARQGAMPLASAVEHDAMFRGRVAEFVRRTHPELADAVTSTGGPPAAAPPTDIAAAAFVLRPPGWEGFVATAARSSERAAMSARADEAARELDRLRGALAAARGAGSAEQEQLREQLAASRSELDDLRRRMRAASDRIRRAEQTAQEEVAAAVADREAARAATRAAETEARRLRARVGELEAALAAARRDGRDARTLDDARLRVLLDTLMGAANGVRRELGLPSTVLRPADLCAPVEGQPRDAFAGIGPRGRPEDDPTIIDAVLRIPGVHLIIDGYNVTKRGYGTLPLQAQRVRLLAGLGPLAGRAAEAEITVVFDATAVASRPVGVTAPRGVRVVFSRLGELADEEIVRLVRAEPPGRPVVVVTSDREVAEASAAAGARAIPSASLLARLER